MSQKELAEAACLTPASVSRYVNGEREPRALTVVALGAGEYRSHTALASQKIIAGMVPDEEPHGFQYIARFPFRGYFRHLYARIRKLWLEEYPVKCLKQAVCQLHLVIYRLAVRV